MVCRTDLGDQKPLKLAAHVVRAPCPAHSTFHTLPCLIFALHGLSQALCRNRLAVRLPASTQQPRRSQLSAGQRRQRWAQLSTRRHLSIHPGADLGCIPGGAGGAACGGGTAAVGSVRLSIARPPMALPSAPFSLPGCAQPQLPGLGFFFGWGATS